MLALLCYCCLLASSPREVDKAPEDREMSNDEHREVLAGP
jgi:hypothetical protein